MSPDDIRQQIELKVVELIKARLSDGSMTEERAQELSQRVLDLIQPGMTFEELYKAISKLDDNAPELSPIVLPIVQKYEAEVTQKVQDQVRRLIRMGQYDAAAQLAHKAVNQDLKLVWGTGKA